MLLDFLKYFNNKTISIILVSIVMITGNSHCADITKKNIKTDTQKNKTPVKNLNSQELIYLKSVLQNRIDSGMLKADEVKLAKSTLAKLKQTKKVTSPSTNIGKEQKDLLQKLRQKVASDPDKRAYRLNLAKFYLYMNDAEKAERHLTRIGPASKKDLIWRILCAQSYVLLGEYSRAAELFDNVTGKLDKIIPLRVTKAVLCDKIRQRGQYSKRATNEISSGEMTWIYLEVQGAQFTPTAKNDLQLNLSFGVEIRDEMQRSVWSVNDYCGISPVYQHEMKDVFAGVDFTLPQKLNKGKHTLIISCTDKNSGRTSSKDIKIIVK
jgi:hypothetical protein